MNGVAACRVAGVDSTPGSASRANARTGGNASLRLAKAGSPARNTAGSRSIASPRATSSAANEPAKTRKLVTRSWQRHLVAPEAAKDPVEAADHAAEVAGLGSQDGLVDLRGELAGRPRGAVELAQALGAAVLDQRVAELVEEDLKVAADVPLQRRQHLVELDASSAVWSTGKVWPSSISSAPGLPGCRSTK